MALWSLAAGRDGRRAEYGFGHDAAVLGWSETGDLSRARSAPDVRRALRAAYPDAPAAALERRAEELWSFVHDVAEGDMVAVRVDPDVAFGRVTGPYRYDAAAPGNRRHQRPVEWVRRTPWASLEAPLRAELETPAALHRVRSRSAAAAPPSRSSRRVSRRTFLGAGAAAAVAAIVAAIWRPWRSSGSRSASTTATTRPAGAGTRGSSASGPTAQWVKDENAKPGTSAWNVTNGGKPHQVEGYASAVSVQRGENVTLYVSTEAPTFHVEAYRMGWYGGAGGRLIWRSSELPGQKQAAATFQPGINMTEAHWSPSLQVSVDSHYPPGSYFLKLVGSNGVQQLIPLTVRDDASTAAYVVQNSVTSWQAYNDWNGYNLYQGQNGAYADRSRIVSFDRPYGRGDGQADFLGLEFPLVQLIEQLGLDVTYITDVDTHLRPQLLLNHKAYFSLGHDEYWSKEMRDGVEAARDKGVNLGFLGANASFRQVRFEPSSLGPNRHLVCYKVASEDPVRTTNPALTSINWREAPVARPESQMIGQQYECNPVGADMVIVDPTAWVFAGTNVTAGTKLTTTGSPPTPAVGSEYDRYDPNQAGPHNVQILTHSPVTCHGRPSFSDMTYYTAASGAGVFSTGTINWIPKLTPPRAGSPNDPIAVQVMKNVLAAFGAGPAGQRHPSMPNYDAISRQFGAGGGGVTGSD